MPFLHQYFLKFKILNFEPGSEIYIWLFLRRTLVRSGYNSAKNNSYKMARAFT